MMGGADVVVADGFTGNVMLKSLEGTGKFLLKELKKMFLSSTRTKLAAAMVKGDMAEMKKPGSALPGMKEITDGRRRASPRRGRPHRGAES